MMTEDEAKTKWCPHVRMAEHGDFCLGSDCMAWRVKVIGCEHCGGLGTVGNVGRPCSRCNGTGEGMFSIDYCGLAGKP